MTLPEARIDVVTDTYFGTTVEDPYRWMEDWTSAEAQAWTLAHAEHARQTLEALPERAALLERVAELSGAAAILTDLRVAAGRCFYLRQDAGDNLLKLCVRLSDDAPERVLFDPASLGGAVHTSIDWFAPSGDGRRVAYGISEGGSENSTLHILDVDSGRQLPDTISRVHFGFVSWLDADSFVYHRYLEPAAGSSPAEARDNSRSYLHRLGDDPADDRLVLGRGLNGRVDLRPIDRPFVIVPAHSRWMIAVISHSALAKDVWSDCTFYVAPRAGLDDPAGCPWTLVAAVEDGVINFAIDGDTLYLVSHRDAPSHRVLAVALAEGARREVFVPESAAVIEDICLAGGYLLTRELLGGLARIRRFPLAGGAADELPLPFGGSILDWASQPGRPEVYLHMMSWTVSSHLYRCDAAAATVADTGWLAPSPADFSAISVTETHAPAADGAMIPLSIIHRAGLERNGDNPTLLLTYGSYGLALRPAFLPEFLAWYERGGVLAVAHVRGGGEYGRAWHEAGRLLNKENTIGDFIACAEYLIAENYARPARLTGIGGSAGGIPTGGALVRRPELWAAMVMQVPLTN
ncbi:MAG TPA: prolyl oligopeptidase family serine peptidase, partial [Herpetosiphonaceae bacterium]|nr:prolyl oligopeptidase family serine peptidase [Herpetosiphonaceae bacterium]